MNKNELDGKVDSSRARSSRPRVTRPTIRQTHDEGVADEAAGKVEAGFGKARRKVGDALHEVAHKIKD